MNSIETNLAVSVSGYVQDRPTQMLVDTGSAVTIVRENVWEEANNLIYHPHRKSRYVNC